MGLIDSHAHLTFPELGGQVDDVLTRCSEAGVDEIITVGTDLADSRAAVELAERYPDRLYVAAGVHPHEAEKAGEDDLVAVARLWEHPKVVAVGEIGLDYHYDFADRAVQRSVFARQLELAETLSRPVVIHAREALNDTIQALVERGYDRRPVVFHCFSGTAEEASRIAEHGWRISFTGMVTFKKLDWLRRIVKAYPADKLMVETDSPYISPEPIRNKRPNEPAHLVYTVRFLAELLDLSYNALVQQTAQNTRAFFNL